MNQPAQPVAGIRNRSMPPGTIIPVLVYDDVPAAVAWLCQVFGFRERLRIGSHRAQLVFGGSAIVVVARPAGERAISPSSRATHSLMVQVDDVDQHHRHAQQRGARITGPPTDYPYGERQYSAEDLAGHRWTFSQAVADVDPRTWGGVLLEPS